jgi:predicted TIM-barrel fold metal-dependent hydrolase
MIVDSHAHVGLDADWPPQFIVEMSQPLFRAAGAEVPEGIGGGVDVDAMMREYRAAGVDKVFIYANGERKPEAYGRDAATRQIGKVHVANEYVAEVHQTYPDLTVPVMSVNPRLHGASIPERVRYAVDELGGKALKLYPTYSHYRPDDRELCWPIYRTALELGIPVIVHQSWTTTVNAPMKFQRPAQLDDVAREFRDLTIVICHFGVPWVDEAMCLVGKHDNVYTDLSFWTLLETPELILRQLLRAPRFGCSHDKILWGTDYPAVTPSENLRLMREELPEVAQRSGLSMVPDAAMDLILGGNAARIFGLAPLPAAAVTSPAEAQITNRSPSGRSELPG